MSASPGDTAMDRLLAGAHLATADDLPGVLAHAAAALGARRVELLLVDHGQARLIALADPSHEVSVEGTLAGRAFRTFAPQHARDEDGGERLWTPLLDGLDRLGVLGLTFGALDDDLLRGARQLASLTAELLVTKSLYSDDLHRVVRRREMGLAAEMQWSLLPPLTAGTPDVAVAATLEPAYDVGGDLVDYAFSGPRAHLAVLDAMGHGVQASILAALAIGAYRNRRRAGDDLQALARVIEDAVAEQFDVSVFVTALLAELDTATGRLRWVNAGHPPPLLLRRGRVVKALAARGDAPLGIGLNEGEFTVHEEALEPGDRLLLYTDGVVEARTPEGEQFGVDRLTDFLIRAAASDEPIPETMRRLSHAVLAHQRGELRDDATQMLVAWRSDAAPELTERYGAEAR